MPQFKIGDVFLRGSKSCLNCKYSPDWEYPLQNGIDSYVFGRCKYPVPEIKLPPLPSCITPINLRKSLIQCFIDGLGIYYSCEVWKLKPDDKSLVCPQCGCNDIMKSTIFNRCMCYKCKYEFTV